MEELEGAREDGLYLGDGIGTQPNVLVLFPDWIVATFLCPIGDDSSIDDYLSEGVILT